MQKYKILIIDDSALMRRVTSDIINTDNRFTVADTAVDGVQGLDFLIRNNGKYDVVLLDVNMPKMNGLEVLKRIKRYNLRCKVIMVSTLVKEGATETILALEDGAIDFVLKPSDTNGRTVDEFRKRLIEAVAVATGSVKDEGNSRQKIIAGKTSVTSKVISGNDKIVAIACSTGGPKSLKEVIPMLPKNLNAPVILVQHMPAGFTKALADRLDTISQVSVKEAEDGDIIQPGHVYIAPGSHHLRVREEGSSRRIVLGQDPPVGNHRPAVNVMYDSVAPIGKNLVAVIMTGMGCDGCEGMKKIKAQGGYSIAQDESTSVVYGMPKAVVDAGLADEVRPVQYIARAIVEAVKK